MTIIELERLAKSKLRIRENELRTKASFDYTLADLIGRSVARVYNASNKFPPIYEAYPSYFTEEEVTKKQEERQAELSALRFKQFADSFNSRFKKEANKVE